MEETETPEVANAPEDTTEEPVAESDEATKDEKDEE